MKTSMEMIQSMKKDRQVIGNPNPKWTLGINLGAT